MKTTLDVGTRKACIWCNSEKVKAKSLCSPCYRLSKNFNLAQSWDLSDENKPDFIPSIQQFYKKDVKKLKDATISALNTLINDRKFLGESFRKPRISGMALESLTMDLAGRIKGVDSKKTRTAFHHTANFFNENFNEKQRVELYRFLKRIHYFIPSTNLNLLIMEEYYKG